MLKLQIEGMEEKYYRFIFSAGLSDCHFTSFLFSVSKMYFLKESQIHCVQGVNPTWNFMIQGFLRPKGSSHLIVTATWLLDIEVATTNIYLQRNHIEIL